MDLVYYFPFPSFRTRCLTPLAVNWYKTRHENYLNEKEQVPFFSSLHRYTN